MRGRTNAENGTELLVILSDFESGTTVTVTDGTNTQTGTTDADGSVVFDVVSGVTYTVSAPTHISRVKTVQEGMNQVTLKSSRFVFSMDYNATTFKTDPTGCLTYADDCTGYTPVSSPPSVLGPDEVIGDWAYNNDGTSSNPLLNQCFYCTFHETELTGETGLVPYEKLNPNDLTMVIATWNEATKEWDAVADPTTGASHITTLNTMFCWPTLYRKSTPITGGCRLTISNDPTQGAAFGAVVDGHTYQYVAIGVYPAYNSSNVLKSISGVNIRSQLTRAQFRTYAHANTVRNGHAMLWNWHQWQDWRIMVHFAMKSFDSQHRIGFGGKTSNVTDDYTGYPDKMGPWGGLNVAGAGKDKWVKALIEDGWGNIHTILDDNLIIYQDNVRNFYVGQNSNPGDTTADKTVLTTLVTNNNGYPNEIDTGAATWAIGRNASGGSSTTALCDTHLITNTNTSLYEMTVGGDSANSATQAGGLNYLYGGMALTNANVHAGTRLAFVFDLE